MSEEGTIGREVTVVQPSALQLADSIDTVAMQRSMEKFHEFVKGILKENVHYGKVPGVAKNFLWQPGAEEIFRAFNVRPAYTTVREQIDFVNGIAFFWRKCEAVHIDSGMVVGEADAICSHEEFRTRNGGWQGSSFGAVVSNALMKADKRAFVKCARTLGCASEFFTQDEDLLDPATPRTSGAAAGRQKAEQPVNPQTGEDMPVGFYGYDGFDKSGNPQLKIKCPKHGWWYAREWGGKDGKPKQVKCGKKEGDKYCDFVVDQIGAPAPATKGTPKPPSLSQDQQDLLKRLMAEAKRPGGGGLKFEDLVPIIGLDSSVALKPSHVAEWLAATPGRTVQELVGEALGRLEELAADGEPVEDGDFREVGPEPGEPAPNPDDDLPFE